MKKDCILVTGGAGYVGSHVTLAFLDSGHRVVVLDNLATGRRAWIPDAARFVEADIGDQQRIIKLFEEESFDAILHLAGSASIPAAAAHPLECYRNNVCASYNLMEAAANRGIDKFIFASSAAVYGNPDALVVSERAATVPCSVYGRSKLMAEDMLQDAAAASGLRLVVLRYFNVTGAGRGPLGGPPPGAMHLIKAACEAACGMRESVTVFGDDYATPDGTAVRDYIHVDDVAAAHVRALDYLRGGGANLVLNCGSGRGHSVRQVLEVVRRVSSKNFPIRVGARRPGDIGAICADTDRARDLLGFAATRGLNEIVASAYAWQTRTVQTQTTDDSAGGYALGIPQTATADGTG